MKRWYRPVFVFLLVMAAALPLSAVGQAAKPTDLSDGPEVYWNFNEGSGNSVKESMGKVAGRDLTVVGKTQWVDGIDGKAFYLDGFTALSMNGDKQLKSMNMSISLWAKVEGYPNPGDEKPLFDMHKFMAIEGVGGLAVGAVEFGFWEGKPDCGIIADKQMNKEGGVAENLAPLDNKWHHYALVIDDAGEKMTYYIDGVVVNEIKLVRTLGLPKVLSVPAEKGFFGNLNIGAYVGIDSTVSRGVKGAIDEIAVYYKALSAADVKKLANTGTDPTTPAATTTNKPGVITTAPQASGTTNANPTENGETTSTSEGGETNSEETTDTAPDTLDTTGEITSTAATSDAPTDGDVKANNMLVPIIVGSILVLGGAGAAVYFLVIRKRMNIN